MECKALAHGFEPPACLSDLAADPRRFLVTRKADECLSFFQLEVGNVRSPPRRLIARASFRKRANSVVGSSYRSSTLSERTLNDGFGANLLNCSETASESFKDVIEVS
jgi:hypothetical protein